jgi:hypothetical protein
VIVSRAADEVLEPAHDQTAGKFASVRRYVLRSGEVAELMRDVDEVLVEQIDGIDGFEGYHMLDCGRGEVIAVSVFRDQSACEESDERALDFIATHLQAADLERSEVIGGEARVSRAAAELLEPAHA